MSFVDKLKGWFFDGPEDDDNGNDEYEEENSYKTKSKQHTKVDTSDYDNSQSDIEENYENTSTPVPPPPPPVNDVPSRDIRENRGRTQNVNNTKRIKVDAVLEVVLVKPEVYTDAKQVADHLMNGKTVVINLENTTPETKRRILDFLTGVAYANKGAIKSVASLTYIITPHNVGFTGDDLVGELENNGVML
ncbi:MAG: cell division protein SepF [Oscillospiraceae bacterium]